MMKNIVLIIAVAGVAMASCKKDRICSCTETKTKTTGNISVTETYNMDVTYTHETNRVSKLSCVHTKSTDSGTNSTTVRESNCVLK